MLSDKGFIKHTEKMLKENPEIFEALVEFEETGKLPKFNYKQRANFTIDANLLRRFRLYCMKYGYKMSTLIEKDIRKRLEDSK